MRSIRKTLRGSRLAVHRQMEAWLRPKVEGIGQRCRLAARIRMANTWATKHPKRTFICVTGALLFLLVGSVAIDNTVMKDGRKAKTEEPFVSQIADVDPLLGGFRAIQQGKTEQRQSVLHLTLTGQQVRQGLDSLISLPRKTHADSLLIVREYKRLEQIVRLLKNNNSDDNKD